MTHLKFSTTAAWINIFWFCVALAAGGILFILSPKHSISESEKRQLKLMPTFSWSSLASGQYLRQLDDYVADNFMWRYTLTELAGEVRTLRGWNRDDVQIFSQVTKKPPTVVAAVLKNSISDTTASDHDSAQTDAFNLSTAESLKVTASDSKAQQVDESAAVSQPLEPRATTMEKMTTTAPEPRPVVSSQSSVTGASISASQTNEDLYENIESIIVYRGRALQMFGGAPQMTQSLAKAINRYCEELAPEINIFFMAVPIGSDFYLPRRVNQGVMREKLAIDHIQTLLDPRVKFVAAYDRLAEHADEYIQFNTDHHWTGLGGYYAYTAFAQSAGFEALPLSDLVKGEIPGFLGTLYQRTMAPSLRTKADVVEYYKIPFKTEATYYPVGSNTPVPALLYAEYARGGNAYGVFLGGDFPLMRIVSEVKNGKKIAVIKDSYGNAFVPYLASHFEEVFVLDYRYFAGNIKTLLEDNGIQNLLFAHNTFVVMGGYTAQRAIGFLTAAPSATPKILDK